MYSKTEINALDKTKTNLKRNESKPCEGAAATLEAVETTPNIKSEGSRLSAPSDK